MSLVNVLSGDYVVWHNRIAQIDIAMQTPLTAMTRLELVVGVNERNAATDIRVFYKTTPLGSYIALGNMALLAAVDTPDDNSFVDAIYYHDCAPTAASYIRLIISQDGVLPKEFAAVKKYRFYNNGVQVIGGSNYKINDLGWQTGEVFKTIFSYLGTTNIADSVGLLPENRIQNDNILARLSENEAITGAWDFQNGQLLVRRGADLPNDPSVGSLFYQTTSGALFIGDGAAWNRIMNTGDFTSTGVYCVHASFAYNTPVVNIVSVPQGAIVKRLQIKVIAEFNDPFAFVTVGSSTANDVLAQASDSHLQRGGEYDLVSDVVFAQSTGIKIFLSCAGTVGSGEVVLEYVVP